MAEIVLHPLGKGQFSAEFGGAIIVTSSATPIFDSCRVLLARGVTGLLEARHAADNYVSARCDIEKGAKLTVKGSSFATAEPAKETENVGY